MNYNISYTFFINNSYGEKFDYFLLTLSWPQTTCWAVNKNWQNTTCNPCKRLSDSWTLHGLWPNNYNGKHPFNCDFQEKFDPNLLSQDLKNQLNDQWPTYKLNFSNKKFWNYEWLKHGTCASKLKATNTPENYFSKALNLLDEINMTTLLEKVNIQPGNQYDYYTLVDTISDGLGVKAQIGCRKNPGTTDQYLYEAYICFDKSFKLVDCHNLQSCKRKGKIIYPKSLKSCQ